MAHSADPFITALVTGLEADPHVVGLILVGSSAETTRRDQWSDHDFLLVTDEGTPERYRTELTWLPESDQIGYWFRETPHGLKALYRSGLLVEFAVFDRAEFAGCAISHYSVPIDRGGIADMAAAIASRSLQPRAVDRLAEYRNLLSLLYSATGRARRGERLSANVFVRNHATDHLLRLLRDLLPEDRRGQLDDLDVWRRFEKAEPGLGAEIDDALNRPVEEAARALLDIADRELRSRWPDCPSGESELIRRLLDW
jgi:hypothetical protein